MADDIVFTNYASSLLAASINDTDVSIQVSGGDGALFPSPSGGQFFYATLIDNAGNREIVQCTARAGDILTVVRGQDNTTAQSFTLNVTRVELRTSAIVLEEFVQKNGTVMTGDLDMDGNNLVDALINGPGTQFTQGEIVGVPIRGTAGVSTNQLSVPASPGRATAGGVPLVVNTDDIVALLDNGSPGTVTLDTGNAAFTAVYIGGGTGTNPLFRVYGSTVGDYFSIQHDDTDIQFVCAGATDLNISSLAGDIVIGAGIDLDLGGNQILQAELIDFNLTAQTVSASTTTNIDYQNGSYVELDMDQNITTLNINNVPTEFATVRLKITQDGAGNRTITNWPGNDRWPSGTPPTLSTGPNDIDFVDLWTDDGGTTWYGAFNTDWS